MSLWWAKREQLDPTQMSLIESLTPDESHLVVGPPGSGKTNVLLRRAQFVRAEGRPRVLVLAFTRSLTEFIKTGCIDAAKREIFPRALVQTIEEWMRWIHEEHGEPLPRQPANQRDLSAWKQALAESALGLSSRGHIPKFETIFVDEAQDLHAAELKALAAWSENIFFVGDSKQQIYGHAVGLQEVEKHVARNNIHALQFHYRLAPEIARVADRILNSSGAIGLTSTGHYHGPRPGRFETHGPLDRGSQVRVCVETIKSQLRSYSDLIDRGDRIGIVVAKQEDREYVFDLLEADPHLLGKSKIIRARNGSRFDEYEVGFDDDSSIAIVTVKGCKGLEFRAVHWLFCDELNWAHSNEHYYTVITRAKTEMDVYYTDTLPTAIASAYSSPSSDIWS